MQHSLFLHALCPQPVPFQNGMDNKRFRDFKEYFRLWHCGRSQMSAENDSNIRISNALWNEQRLFMNGTKGVCPWGIQIGPFAVHETYFCKMDFHFINRPDAAFPLSCITVKWTPHNVPNSEWHQGVYDPGAFKLDHLQSTKPIFAKWISTLLTGHMQHFPFPAYSEMDTPQCTH